MKNLDFTPKNHMFSNFRGARGCAHPPGFAPVIDLSFFFMYSANKGGGAPEYPVHRYLCKDAKKINYASFFLLVNTKSITQGCERLVMEFIQKNWGLKRKNGY